MIMTLVPHLHKLTHTHTRVHILLDWYKYENNVCVSWLNFSSRRFSSKECIYARKNIVSLVHWKFYDNLFDSAIIQSVLRGYTSEAMQTYAPTLQQYEHNRIL